MEVEFDPKTLFRKESWISRIYYKVKYFFKYTLGKPHMNVVKTAFKGEPWDDSYLLDLEAAKIKEMMEWHKEKQRFVGVEQVIRDMRICLSLIEIFTGKRDLFHYTGKLLTEPTEDGERRRIRESPDFKYHCDVKVNTKNVSRFVTDEKMAEWYTRCPHELYELKARYLYHKIRCEREGTWWD